MASWFPAVKFPVLQYHAPNYMSVNHEMNMKAFVVSLFADVLNKALKLLFQSDKNHVNTLVSLDSVVLKYFF